MFKISIPKPCFEGWENMTPNEQGRYCNACEKTVVDFSVMGDEAIQEYFISNYGSKTCGRFKNTQLQRIVIDLPKNIFSIPLPFWKKFLVAFLICFGTNFLAIDTIVAGSFFQQADTLYQQSMAAKETIQKPAVLNKKHRKKRNHIYSLDVSLSSMSNLFIDCKIPALKDITLTGYCVIQKEPNPNFPSKDLPAYIGMKENLNTDTSTIEKNNANSVPKKETPKPKKPDPTTAFILPSALALRKPFSKNKKA